MLITLPVLQVNELYDTKQRMFVLGGWFRNGARKRAFRLLADGRYLRIDANLRYFYLRYAEILAERDEAESWTDVARSERFLNDRRVYYDYIEEAQKSVVASADELRELEGLRRELLRESNEKWEQRKRELRQQQTHTGE